MQFPILSDQERLRLLEAPTGRVRVVIDTDTYNEIDDQFALVYASLSPQNFDIQAIYAAPFYAAQFHGDRSVSPEDGMLKSYDEIGRVLEVLGKSADGFVHRGSIRWLESVDRPVQSAAAEHLIALSRATIDGPLYVVAIGAITNIASAILLAPDIIERIVVVWLGGNPHYWHPATEFNMYQDMTASRVLFDCGVALVHVPCINVTEHLRISRAEMEHFVRGRSAIGNYLFRIFAEATGNEPMASRVIWDIGPFAWFINPLWTSSALIHSPILTGEQTWSHNPQRHFIREMLSLQRDAICADFLTKIERFNSQ